MKKSTSSKMRVGAAALAVAVLLAVYLWAALRPGVWLRNAFLYQQTDGSFSGKDFYGRYVLDITSARGETDVQFCLDDVPTRYRIYTETAVESGPSVKIYREELLLFSGSAVGEPGNAVLWNKNGGLADDIRVVVNGEYTQEDLQPSCQWLYNVAVGGRRETRGDVSFLIPMALLAILLVLDNSADTAPSAAEREALGEAVVSVSAALCEAGLPHQAAWLDRETMEPQLCAIGSMEELTQALSGLLSAETEPDEQTVTQRLAEEQGLDYAHVVALSLRPEEDELYTASGAPVAHLTVSENML